MNWFVKGRSGLSLLLLVATGTIGMMACGGEDDVSPSSAQTSFVEYLAKAECGPEDRVETGLQGQVPVADRLSGRSKLGYNCNLSLISNLPSAAFANMDSYKNCVYYSDNTGGLGSLMGQGGAADGGGVVLDVSDPAHPVKTAYLTAWAMKNAGESLRVNHKRGLLVATYYNVGSLAVYDVSQDCRHPVLLADIKVMPKAAGHYGCFSPDGMTYWMSNPNVGTITPIDLTDPSNPKEITTPWALPVHGCSISDDGNRGYFARVTPGAIFGGSMAVVDTTEVQQRKVGAKFALRGNVDTSADAPVQQGTYILTYDGRPYVFNYSESTQATGKTDICPYGYPSNFGFARMFDVSDEAAPKEVSQFKLETYDPKHCALFQTDRSVQTSGTDKGDVFWQYISYTEVYDTHECRPDRLHNPTIMACVLFGAGLRVWDIRDPARPREIAYYNTGTVDTAAGPALDFVLSPPVIRRDLGQVWWVSLYGGFHVAKFREGVWPFKDDVPCVDGYDYHADQYDATYCRSTWNKAAGATAGPMAGRS